MAGGDRYTDYCPLGRFSVKPQKRQFHTCSPTLWTSLLFLLNGLTASGEDSVPTQVVGTLGGFVILPLNISVGTEIENVAWSAHENALALANPGGHFTIIDKSYKSRLSISSQSYSLTISNLNLKDEGSYKAQINRKNSNVTISKRFVLHIYEQLREPQVTVKHTVSENASCNLTLVCSMEGAEKNVLYNWTLVGSHAEKSFEGSTLTTSWMPCDPDVAYTCTAKNPVSQSSSRPVHALQFCKDPGASRRGTMGDTVMGMLGESVTLPLAVLASQNIEKVVWMFNTSVIIKERREAATAGPHIKSKEPGKERVWVSNQHYALKISRLKLEDAGPYNAYVCSYDSRVTSTKHFTLRVYRELKKPEITWSPGPAEDGICRVILRCSVEDSGDEVTYGWTYLEKGAVVSRGGSLLNISWSSSDHYPNFTCTAVNPVSNSSWQFLSGNICPEPVRSIKHWIILLPIISTLLCFGIFSWCIWMRKTQYTAAAYSSNQAEITADTSGYKKINSPHEIARQQPRISSNNSFDNTLTTEEDQERIKMQEPVGGSDVVYDLATQERASKEQAGYDHITPNNMVPESMVQGNTVYTQVFFNFKGKKPVLQKKESSDTVYCSIQKPQLVEPLPQQNDESPETPAYENFS